MRAQKVTNFLKLISILLIHGIILCSSSVLCLAESYLSPSVKVQNGDLQQSIEGYTATTDNLEELSQIDPDLVQEMEQASAELKQFVKTASLSDSQDPTNEVMIRFKTVFTNIEARLMSRSRTLPQKTNYSSTELSLDMKEQTKITAELIDEIKNNPKLNSKQKEILLRWASYSLNVFLPLLAMTESVEDTALLYARLREGISDIMNLVIQYDQMIKNGEVNPDAVNVQIAPDDERNVKFEKVTLPDGTQRRCRIVSFPAKNDPFHLGHVITILNALVYGKADKVIHEVDNFDYRKPSLTMLVLREITAEIGTDLINQMFEKVAVVYAPCMRIDQTLQPDGEHILPLLVKRNAQASMDAVNNAEWFHLAGGDHQAVTYKPDNKVTTLDSAGKIAFLKGLTARELSLEAGAVKMGVVFNGRPGETAPELLTAGQIDMIGIPLINSVQRLQVSSTDLRDKAIWAFLPYEIAVLAKILHVPRWENSDDVNQSVEQEQQQKIAEAVIDYLKEVIPQGAIDEDHFNTLLTGARGFALQEIDTFINFNRDQLLKLTDQSKTIDLTEKYNYSWTVVSQDFSIRRIKTLRNVLFEKVRQLWNSEKDSSDNTLPISAKISKQIVKQFLTGSSTLEISALSETKDMMDVVGSAI